MRSLWLLPALLWCGDASAQSCPDAGADACVDWLAGLSGASEGSGFWRHQLQRAADGKTNGVAVTAEELDILLEDLRGFALPESMHMDGYLEAVAVLEVVDNSDAGMKFGKELLLAELNHFYGLGLSSAAMSEHILFRCEHLAIRIGLGLADPAEVAWYQQVLATLNSL